MVARRFTTRRGPARRERIFGGPLRLLVLLWFLESASSAPRGGSILPVDSTKPNQGPRAQASHCRERYQTQQGTPQPLLPLVFYNRIGKAGSSNMLYLLRRLHEGLMFDLHIDANYYQPTEQNLARVSRVFANAVNHSRAAVYVNHQFFADIARSEKVRKSIIGRDGGNRHKVHLINFMRDPIERFRSTYNYHIDVNIRGKAAEQEIKRREERRCGCAGLSFSRCVEDARSSGCIENEMLFSHTQSTAAHFLTRSEYHEFTKSRCDPEAALGWIERAKRNMDMYTAIGLVERMEDSLRLFERRIPAVFSGASSYYSSQPRSARRETTKQSGVEADAVSPEAERILRSSSCNAMEFAIWEHAKDLFERALADDECLGA